MHLFCGAHSTTALLDELVRTLFFVCFQDSVHSFLFLGKAGWLLETPYSSIFWRVECFKAVAILVAEPLSWTELENLLKEHLGSHQRVLSIPGPWALVCPKTGVICFSLDQGNPRVFSPQLPALSIVFTCPVRPIFLQFWMARVMRPPSFLYMTTQCCGHTVGSGAVEWLRHGSCPWMERELTI